MSFSEENLIAFDNSDLSKPELSIAYLTLIYNMCKNNDSLLTEENINLLSDFIKQYISPNFLDYLEENSLSETEDTYNEFILFYINEEESDFIIKKLLTLILYKVDNTKKVYGYNCKTGSWHCMVCGTDMGIENSRQYCNKTYCPYEC